MSPPHHLTPPAVGAQRQNGTVSSSPTPNGVLDDWPALVVDAFDDLTNDRHRQILLRRFGLVHGPRTRTAVVTVTNRADTRTASPNAGFYFASAASGARRCESNFTAKSPGYATAAA